MSLPTQPLSLYSKGRNTFIYEKSTMTKFKQVGQPRTQVGFQKEGLGKANKEYIQNKECNYKV